MSLASVSLGSKDVAKDSHVSWIVTYRPDVPEARGSKAGQQAMVARRETVGPAAKLYIRADRSEIGANGEDFAFFTVEGIVDGSKISFRVGPVRSGVGRSEGEIELNRSAAPMFGGTPAATADNGLQPAIGPPPDGSDPWLVGFRFGGGAAPILLRRANR